MPKESFSSDVKDYRPISNTLLRPKVFEKIVTEKLGIFLESISLLTRSQFSYRKGVETWDALLTLSHHLQVALNMGMKGRYVQLDFSAAFDRVSYPCLLHKLRSIGVGGQFLSSALLFMRDRRLRVQFDCKVSMSVNVVSGVVQSNVFGPLLFILYTSELFHIIGSHMVNYSDDTAIYALILRPLSRSQGIDSLNHDLVAINSYRHMRLNPKKMRFMVVSRSWIIAPGYGDLTL